MRLSELAPVLGEDISGTVEARVPLARFTTYRLGGLAELYVEVESAEDLVAMGGVLRARGATEIDVLVLGRGSNMVISDDGWPGLAIKLGRGLSWIGPLSDYAGAAIEGDGLAAGSATPLPQVGNWAARRGLSGLEFTIGVPGSVGGAVKMNAGAHGQQIADSLAATRIFDLSSFQMQERPAQQLQMTYRHTNLGDHHLVVDAAFVLQAQQRQEIRKRMDEWRKHRSETQPGALQNAGSTFKNPPGDSAGRLVEAAGLKGFSVGGASVSSKHANFFMASDGATAQDVYDLVSQVKKRVLETSGVTLEPEIRFIGRFRETE